MESPTEDLRWRDFMGDLHVCQTVDLKDAFLLVLTYCNRFVPPNARFTPPSRPCASLDVSMRQVLTPRLILVTLGHFTIDSYSSFFSPLLPLLVTKLHLSLTLVGTLVAFSALSSSFAQPLFGWFADRVDRPWFVAFGPLVAAVFLSSIGLAPSYGALVGLLMLGGIGVAAFLSEVSIPATLLSTTAGSALDSGNSQCASFMIEWILRPVASDAAFIAWASALSVVVCTSVTSKPISRASAKRSLMESSFGNIETSTDFLGLPAAAAWAWPVVPRAMRQPRNCGRRCCRLRPR